MKRAERATGGYDDYLRVSSVGLQLRSTERHLLVFVCRSHASEFSCKVVVVEEQRYKGIDPI